MYPLSLLLVIISLCSSLTAQQPAVTPAATAEAAVDALLAGRSVAAADQAEVGLDVAMMNDALAVSQEEQRLRDRAAEEMAQRRMSDRKKLHALLPAEAKTILELAYERYSKFAQALRLEALVHDLAQTIKTDWAAEQPAVADAAAVVALDTFDTSVLDGTFTSMMVSSIKQSGIADLLSMLGMGAPALDPAVQAAYQKSIAALIVKLTSFKVVTEEEEALATILRHLLAKDTQAMALACFNQIKPELLACRQQLSQLRDHLLHVTLPATTDKEVRRALEFWIKATNGYIGTLDQVKSMASTSKLPFATFLMGAATLYDLFLRPYFQFESRVAGLNSLFYPVERNGVPQGMLSLTAATWLDLAARSSIAVFALAANKAEMAGRDLTNVVLGDSALIAQIDPMGDGGDTLAMQAIMKNLGQGLERTTSAIGTVLKNAMLPASCAHTFGGAGQRCLIRFVLAVCWHEATKQKNWALNDLMYQAIMRECLALANGYVSGSIEQFLVTKIGGKNVAKVEYYTMGLISPRLIPEFTNVLMSVLLAQRFGDSLVKFDDRMIYATSPWYYYMMKKFYTDREEKHNPTIIGPKTRELAALDARTPEELRQAERAYFQENQLAFVQYSALYYVFGCLGEYWAKRLAKANTKNVTSMLMKGWNAFASWSGESEAEAVSRGQMKETIMTLLQSTVGEIMHDPTSSKRIALVRFMKTNGLIAASLQDDQTINDALMECVLNSLYYMHIFDYRQIVECQEMYWACRKNLAGAGLNLVFEQPVTQDKLQAAINTLGLAKMSLQQTDADGKCYFLTYATDMMFKLMAQTTGADYDVLVKEQLETACAHALPGSKVAVITPPSFVPFFVDKVAEAAVMSVAGYLGLVSGWGVATWAHTKLPSHDKLINYRP